MAKARVIAMYLPQYHPIPENDAVWGKGFTEWTNVAKAKPLYPGHYQPKIPADLGFYDLRMPEVREAQAELAREAGIEGFMYWHYWFGNGRMLLQRPFEEVVATGKPDFPFCLGWANHSWMTKTWTKGNAFQKDPMIMEQLYPGKNDWELHFEYCLPAFKDHRYITVDGKPLFTIWAPMDMPDVKEFIAFWRQKAIENGLKGIHFVGLRYGKHTVQDILNLGFDAVNNRDTSKAMDRLDKSHLISYVRFQLRRFGIPVTYNYKKLTNVFYTEEDYREDTYPTIISGYDRTPRAGANTVIYTHYTPDSFKEQIKKALETVCDKQDEHKIIYLQSWNEWGEGNYVEPDLKYGKAFLNAIRDVIK